MQIDAVLWRKPPTLCSRGIVTAMVKAAVILGMLAVVAAVLAGGRYTVTQQGTVAYVVDRFTGAVRFCTQEECSDVPNAKPEPTEGFARQPEKQPWPGTPVPREGNSK
jgi:hypothetical protein